MVVTAVMMTMTTTTTMKPRSNHGGGEWLTKPILCTVRIPTFGAPGQGQTLDVYLRPDY